MKRYYKCEICGAECWNDELGSCTELNGETFNACPECGSMEIYETDPPPILWTCLDCDKKFIEDDIPAYKDAYTCPFCGSENVTDEDVEEGT